MPIYEYACAACGRVTEVIQRLDDPPLAACPECGGAVKKLLSAPAFQFKGEGWYVTDYARKGGDKSESGKGAAARNESSSGGATSGSESAAAPAKSGGSSTGPDSAPKPAAKD